MTHKIVTMAAKKNIALIAHDSKKEDLLQWVDFNRALLVAHNLFATRTTGQLLAARLGLNITALESGPLGGDQQIGARISEGLIDLMVFFWDPLGAQPHDSDVKALLRIAVVWNIPVASDRSSADFMISSELISAPYRRLVPDYSS